MCQCQCPDRKEQRQTDRARWTAAAPCPSTVNVANVTEDGDSTRQAWQMSVSHECGRLIDQIQSCICSIAATVQAS